MIEQLGDPTRIEATMVTIHDDVRAIHDLITGSISYEQKKQVGEVVGSYYRYVSSVEEQVGEVTSDPTSTIYRLRYVYSPWMGDMELHITFRTTVADRISQAVSIEVETPVEYTASRVMTIADRVMRLHNGDHISNLAMVISRMKRATESMGLRSTAQLQRPFDLTWRNFTHEDLIENKVAVSFKADGTRMLLAMSEQDIFYVTSNLDIVPIKVGIEPGQPTILMDGELMGNTYYAFDILFLDGQSTMNLQYDQRHQLLAQAISSMEQMDGLVIETKPIIIPEDEASFHDAVREMLDVPIETDGLILTPVNQPYSNSVYKWKPQNLMSVDFFIGADYTMYTFDDGKLLHHPELTLAQPTGAKIGTVAELQYEGDGQWSYIRDRLDKATPNAERVYLAITRLIQDPIDEASMLGLSLKPMRKFHNRIKTSIYEYLRSRHVSTITDIGAGRGGDLSKYRSFAVQALEPDEQNIHGQGGFLDRARAMGASVSAHDGEWDIISDDLDVTLIHGSAQTFIPVQESDALTLFNVATFLGPDVLNELAENAVIDDGYMVIMAMDGRCLSDTFLEGGTYDSDLIYMARSPCGNITETFGDLGCIRIQLKDSSTVLRPQVEGLVDTTMMLDNLKERGWDLIMDAYLDGEHMLGREGQAYSSCQRVSILKRTMIGDTLIRPSYNPLLPGQEEDIDTPYGPLVRVGVLQQMGGASLGHAILQASNPDYRSADDIGKSIFLASLPRDWQPSYTVYQIREDGWVRYYMGDDDAGITVMKNKGHWEPLARRGLDGQLIYVW